MADFELLLHADFGIYASREGEILESLDRLWRGITDVDKALVDFHFKSFATGLVDMRGFHYRKATALGW